MKKILILLGLQLSVGSWQVMSAQDKPDKPSSAKPTEDKQNIQVVTTQDASFPHGEQALYTYIMNTIKYSEEAKKKYIQGNITLSFDVMPDSTVANVKIISDLGYGIGEEAKRLLSQLKFIPAIQMGIKVKMNLMMDFPVKAH